MNSEIGDRIAAFLDSHHVMSLATCSRDGPHAANVFYARDGFALFWISDPNSRHSLDLAADPRAAVTIAPDFFDFGEVTGLQVHGKAEPVHGSFQRHRARVLLETRYPFLKRLADGAPAVKQAYDTAEFYRLDPHRIVIIDNTRGFGHKDVVDFTASV